MVSTLTEKITISLIFLGFILFSIGCVYTVIILLLNSRASLEIFLMITGLVLMVFSFMGLILFRRFYLAEE